ncbi:AraC family transcriptional regulator [Echinicola vietnamensis]|uniref:DNA-binding domain-containing protein, AraC-type n=1 Tax=Echinicola vietnamensis (strain DSM 17526 / LMG 23754 / KMM 6221) TaxID=926556 RepID=L0G0U1_ECHVK|nr:helix-turn-helix transcriptional regulator [Echinicola vietnamensis]AGA79162.1 DNA-binding domain-containing protein, AraC-type [Echinicola vietnamensis DSM 17526]
MKIGLKKKLEDELVLKVSRMKQVIKPTKPHKHAGYHELIFLSKGSGKHTIGDETFDVIPPSGFYLGPGQVHCWDFSKIPDGYVILFKEEILVQYPKSQNCLFDFPNYFDLSGDNGIFKILDIFFKTYKAGSDLDFLTAYLNLVIIKSSALAKMSRNNYTSFTREFTNFKQVLNEHFREVKHVERYAEMMNLSVKKLNKICKTSVNATAREVIRERMLIEAKNLLTHTDSTVSEIAFELNFTDSSNFVKFFKAQTTLTPLEYRARAIG